MQKYSIFAAISMQLLFVATIMNTKHYARHVDKKRCFIVNKDLTNRIKQLLSSSKVKEFVRFGIVGVLATGIHYGVYYLLEQIVNVNVAYTIGYVVAWCVNLYLTAYFTFKSQLSVKKGVGFAFSHLANYLLHMIFLNIFLTVGLSEEIAPLFVFAIVIPMNFLLVRFVFKSKRFQNQEQ